ncbi:hypothetical protein [Facilibium subflavum]|uniref:hypothetical protein n=1 Tax=Facilibium subflavum TaxID=2219058 RepID=UPI001F24DD25|nr:hypothetical protein [Facilibium subflavum]
MGNEVTADMHSKITLVLPDIYMVTGTNKTCFEGQKLQHSRNMIIIKSNNELTLINTVKLSDQGLAELDALGEVKHIIRIGAFHGRDDAFYKARYQAKLWALEGMQDENNALIDALMTASSALPVKNSQLIVFKTARFPEACIYLADHDGVLITCDSIKNWESADPYFSEETAKLYQQQNMFGVASVSPVWINAMGVSKDDFDRISKLQFKHLLTAHGKALLTNAKDKLLESITNAKFVD